MRMLKPSTQQNVLSSRAPTKIYTHTHRTWPHANLCKLPGTLTQTQHTRACSLRRIVSKISCCSSLLHKFRNTIKNNEMNCLMTFCVRERIKLLKYTFFCEAKQKPCCYFFVVYDVYKLLLKIK